MRSGDDTRLWTGGASHVYELDGADGGMDARCLAHWEAAPGAGDMRAFRSARWSPDGTMIATMSEDNALRVYDADDAVQRFASGTAPAIARGTEPWATLAHGETVLDYAWHPHSSRYYAGGKCIAVSVRDHPIHLRDIDAPLRSPARASYRAVDACDMLLSATALAFAPDDACALFAGYNAHLARFDVLRPGLPTQMVRTSPTRKSHDGMKGVVSSVAPMPAAQGSLVACASLGNHVALHARGDLDARVALWAVPAEYAGSGVTALRWAQGGSVVWAASRQSRYIVGWDVRDLRGPCAVLQRSQRTGNQRMEIDVDGTGVHVAAGQLDGSVSVYGPHDDAQPVASFAAHSDAVPALAMHPFYPLLASASGQRHFGDPAASSDCSLKIWSLNARYLPHAEQGSHMTE
ncbi:hypothetical protein GGI22_002520 [Coemansia erecta]|nr:hypothetical protein GGI22_002520 [Coemansia erecta]